MSTRCNIAFTHGSDKHKDKVALLYRHCDGYPEGTGDEFAEFFADVMAAAPEDTRFGDPQYLSARYVVWLTAKYAAASKEHALAQTGIGVALAYAPDGEYLYVVSCENRDALPIVYVHELRNGEPNGEPKPLSDFIDQE